MGADGLDRLRGGGFGVRQRENLSRKITSEADVPERGDDRGSVRVTEADRLAVAIGEVDVSDVAAAGAERGSVRDLLDVHMEQVAE